MTIEPKYVTFDQAKKLKEKGFNVPSNHLYCIGFGSLKARPDVIPNTIKDDEGNVLGFKDRTAYHDQPHLALAPEQYKVRDWLATKNIWVEVKPTYEYGWSYNVFSLTTGNILAEDCHFSTSTEAYSAAFDYILDKII